MNAGKLDRRITIQRATVVTNPLGEESLTWGDLATVWASVEYVRDGERFQHGELAASVDMRFRIRWGQGVTVEDRIAYEGRTFSVVGVKELGRREGQEISVRGRAE